MTALQAVLALVFAAACIYTVLGYPHKYGALSGRSRLFRTVGLFLLNLFLGLSLLGTLIDFQSGVPPRVAAIRFTTYWLAVIFLFLSLMCVLLLDWLEGYVIYRREQRKLIRQMADEEPEGAEERDDAPPGEGT